MIDDLKNFEAPPARHWLLAAPMLAIVLWACNVDFDSAQVNDKIVAESKAHAEAPSGPTPSLTLPMAYPLGCPEEDEAGRKLKATLSIKGERRPRCYYGGK